MFYGGWEEEVVPKLAGDEVVSVSFVYSPGGPDDRPTSRALHGPLSSIYSRMFEAATINADGEISDLRAIVDPGSLRALLPDNYAGPVLHIWRMHLRPS
jgi:hypothetical protein